MKACVGINVNCDSSKPILYVNQIANHVSLLLIVVSFVCSKNFKKRLLI